MTCSPSTNFGSQSGYTGLGVNNLLHAPPPFKSTFISRAELPVGWNCVLYQHLPSTWRIARAQHPCLGWMNAGQWPPVGRGRRIPSPNWASVATLKSGQGFLSHLPAAHSRILCGAVGTACVKAQPMRVSRSLVGDRG